MMNKKVDMGFMDVIQTILCDYSSTCSVPPFEGQIVIAEDIKKSYIELRSDLAEERGDTLEDIEKFHGLTVQPKDSEGKFTILLNKKYIMESIEKGNVNWIGTLVHEAVHVNDFKKYFMLVSPASYDELYEYNLHRPFLHWTEFHARAIGYYFLRKYTLDDFKNSVHIDNLLNRELPFQANYMVTEVSATNDTDRQMYVIVHFLGRLAVWQYLYPNVFDERFINGMMKGNPWMEELYYLFVKYKSLEEIYPHFNEIEGILDKHFTVNE